MSAAAVPYEDAPEFPTLEYELCMRIEELAKLGITREEILEGYSLAWEQLTLEERDYFSRKYARGVLSGKAVMARHLLKHSESKSGLPATMAYLRRFAENFVKPVEGAPGSPADSMESFHFLFGQPKDEA